MKKRRRSSAKKRRVSRSRVSMSEIEKNRIVHLDTQSVVFDEQTQRCRNLWMAALAEGIIEDYKRLQLNKSPVFVGTRDFTFCCGLLDINVEYITLCFYKYDLSCLKNVLTYEIPPRKKAKN